MALPVQNILYKMLKRHNTVIAHRAGTALIAALHKLKPEQTVATLFHALLWRPPQARTQLYYSPTTAFALDELFVRNILDWSY